MRVEFFLLGMAESLGAIAIAAVAATTWTVSVWAACLGFPQATNSVSWDGPLSLSLQHGNPTRKIDFSSQWAVLA